MNSPFEYMWWVLLLPFLGFLFQALCGKVVMDSLGPKWGRIVMGLAGCLPVVGAFAVGAVATQQLGAGGRQAGATVLTLFDWITLQSISIPFEIRVDALSMTMTLIVTGVGALIHIYATGYMAEDREYTRFFTYFNLFIVAMLILVLGNNLAMTFIGWEGVGLCSYLLIGFWYKDIDNAKAGNKAFIVNRIGDVGMILGMFLLVVLVAGNRDKLGISDPRWLSFDVIFPRATELFGLNPGVSTFIALMLFLGAMGKSAQFPLYLWLPDAMAGPTPVSALIHAATMVTSGVYLLNRMHMVFDASPVAMIVVTLIGAFTALLGALIAFGQTDIKKVLAYSTVSQLGYMFIACGVGAYWAGIFHVATHAFFKALLFLGSGAVIMAMAHDQDMRNYGNLWRYLRITAVVMLIGWGAISGFPLMAGFYSKEAILGGALTTEVFEGFSISYGQIAFWTGLGVAGLTAAYMTRLAMLTFFGGQERWKMLPAEVGHHATAEQAIAPLHGPDEDGFFYNDEEMQARKTEEEGHHALSPNHVPREVSPTMWAPLVVLAIGSVVGGWLWGVKFPLKEWLYPELGGHAVEHAGPIPESMLPVLSIVVATIGIVYAFIVYRRGLPEREGWDLAKWSPFRRSAGRQFGYDGAMYDLFVKEGGEVANGTWKWFDAGLIDGIVNGVAYVVGGIGELVRRIQTGYVRAYALLVWLGAVGLLGYLLYALSKMGGAQ